MTGPQRPPFRLGSLRLPPPGFTTRFAPAPTGFLHLGHVVNAIWVWGSARAGGGRVLLRIEDHDRTRCRPEYEAALLEDLAWLGLVADEAPVRQSGRGELYGEHLARLGELVFPCRCTRREIAAAGPDGAELRYPGTCRAAAIDPASTAIRRVRVDDEEIAFDDLRLGPLVQNPWRQCGDLLAVDRDGCWTYQFAVTVDDLEQGVDLVVRGEDLLASTGRQIQLARRLGRRRPPRFLHHGLVLRPDGSKLSKANRDEGVRDLRAAGRRPAEVLGLAAAAAGLLPDPAPIRAAEIGGLFATLGLAPQA